ncbi:hypothetical protein, partial [Variovorax rhizosphaerae]
MNDDRLTLNPPPGPARHRYKTGQDSCRRPAKLIVANHEQKGLVVPPLSQLHQRLLDDGDRATVVVDAHDKILHTSPGASRYCGM